MKLKVILGGVIAVGVMLVGFSGLHNNFLLFLGLGLILSAVITWLLKKHSRVLLLPFILLLALGLFIFNRINFQANSFAIDYIDSQGYSSFLYYENQGAPLEGEEITELSADADLDLKQTATIKFVFEPQPNLVSSDLILEDYYDSEDGTRAVWLWTAEQPDAIYNHVSTQEDTSDDEMYASVITLETRSDPTIESYEILLNDESIVLQHDENNLYYFYSTQTPEQINRLQVIEIHSSSTININSARSTIQGVYFQDAEKAPLAIQQINLFKYMESLNRFLPFYTWPCNEISNEFDVVYGEIIIKNNSCYLYPDGLRPELQLNESPAAIVSKGLINFTRIILTVNSVYTVLLLGLFAGLSVLLDKYSQNLLSWINCLKTKIHRIQENEVFDRMLKGVTPAKVLLFIIILTSLILTFAFVSSGWTKFLQIILVFLSLISFVFIIIGIDLEE